MDFSTIRHFAPEEECVMNLQCMQDEASEIDRKSHLPKKKKKIGKATGLLEFSYQIGLFSKLLDLIVLT